MNSVTDALIVYPDGREVCRDTPDGKMLYILRRFIAWVRQEKRCAICFRLLLFILATSDHKAPRGMGGGRRDDRQENIQAVCIRCNGLKGSRRDY